MEHIIIFGIALLLVLFLVVLAKMEFKEKKLSKINWVFLIILYITFIEIGYALFFVLPYLKVFLVFIKSVLL